MNPPAKRESLPAVTAAGVVAIIFSVFAALGCLFGGIGILLLPQLQTAQGMPPMPPEIRAVETVILLFFLSLAVFGVFVGVGVLRRRNWARITMLVWGGIMTILCLAVVSFGLLIFSTGAGLDLPNANGVDVIQVARFIRVFIVIFYGIPAGVGVWWLVLFTRKRVAMAFANPSLIVQMVDASGFPQHALSATTPQQKKPTCPLPLAIVAGLLLFGAVFLVLFVFIPLPPDMPFYFFGHAFFGSSPRFVFIVFGLISGATGVGILKLKPWALHTEIIFQFVGILNCIIAASSPNYPQVMRVAIQKMYSQNPFFSAGSPLMSDTYLRSTMILSALLIAAMLAVLLWQRSRFLEQAEAAAATKT